MIPTSCPFLSRTGTPLMRRLIMSLATSSIVVSRVVVATALYMTSLALIRLSSCWGKLHSQTTQALDLDQRDSRSRLEYQILPAILPVIKGRRIGHVVGTVHFSLDGKQILGISNVALEILRHLAAVLEQTGHHLPISADDGIALFKDIERH